MDAVIALLYRHVSLSHARISERGGGVRIHAMRVAVLPHTHTCCSTCITTACMTYPYELCKRIPCLALCRATGPSEASVCQGKTRNLCVVKQHGTGKIVGVVVGCTCRCTDCGSFEPAALGRSVLALPLVAILLRGQQPRCHTAKGIHA